jgi:hypothetical protein
MGHLLLVCQLFARVRLLLGDVKLQGLPAFRRAVEHLFRLSARLLHTCWRVVAMRGSALVVDVVRLVLPRALALLRAVGWEMIWQMQ